MRGVDREAEFRDALAPVDQVPPVAADRGEEDTARTHPQDRRHVLDQGSDATAQARLGIEAEELLDGVRVDGAGGPELVRREWNEQVDRQHG